MRNTHAKQVYRVTKMIGIVVIIAAVKMRLIFRSLDLEGPTSTHDNEVRYG